MSNQKCQVVIFLAPKAGKLANFIHMSVRVAQRVALRVAASMGMNSTTGWVIAQRKITLKDLTHGTLANSKSISTNVAHGAAVTTRRNLRLARTDAFDHHVIAAVGASQACKYLPSPTLMVHSTTTVLTQLR